MSDNLSTVVTYPFTFVNGYVTTVDSLTQSLKNMGIMCTSAKTSKIFISQRGESGCKLEDWRDAVFWFNTKFDKHHLGYINSLGIGVMELHD